MKSIKISTGGVVESSNMMLDGITLINKTGGDWNTDNSIDALTIYSRHVSIDKGDGEGQAVYIKTYDVEDLRLSGEHQPELISQEVLESGTVVKTYIIRLYIRTLRGDKYYYATYLHGLGGKRIDILDNNVDFAIQGTYSTGYINPWSVSSEQLIYSDWRNNIVNCVIKNVDGEVPMSIFENNTGINYFEFHSYKAILTGSIYSLANSYATLSVIWVGTSKVEGDLGTFFDLLKAKGAVNKSINIYFGTSSKITNNIPSVSGLTSLKVTFDQNGDWTAGPIS